MARTTRGRGRPRSSNSAGAKAPPPWVVVGAFSIRQAQDPEPVEGPSGDKASVWKPTPTNRMIQP